MLRQDNAGAEVASAPALVGRDEFQLAIPWRGGLHQSPPPLHQPGAVCSKLSLPVEEFTVNGELSLNRLSHPRGQAQKVSPGAAHLFSKKSLIVMTTAQPQVILCKHSRASSAS